MPVAPRLCSDCSCPVSPRQILCAHCARLRYEAKVVARLLNRLIWKMRMPVGTRTADDVAGWLLAELDALAVDVEWSSVLQLFRPVESLRR